MFSLFLVVSLISIVEELAPRIRRYFCVAFSLVTSHSGTTCKGGPVGESLPNLKHWPFRRAKAVAQFIPARQLTGPLTIGKPLLLK